ncbi:3-deoxy-D-manno-octulosonic acid kinase [Paraglaciecola sp.]|uniref:3-deoxy-D-manno-octulosonic acid kinase n=1 Tax=Paraglaciecola sp. TaxID=1920173 RepID=UPI003EFAC4F5
MPNIQEKTLGSQIILFDPKHFAEPTPKLFSGEHWAAENKIIGQATGRGTTYFFKHQDQEYVLRHYLRGGLIGKILDDQYMFTGIQNTRSWQEFNLLQHMINLGLPCPTPIAAMVTKKGLHYSADIILAKIEQAKDVCNILLTQEIPQETWRDIGKTIAQFHQHNIYHHDLNIHNIMIDKTNKVWLIDFDKCGVKQGTDWQPNNISRLHRSLEKEKRLHNIYWQDSDWQALLAGYDS